MGSLSSDVSELLLAYNPDFVELETAPLLLDDTSLQGVIPEVLGGADGEPQSLSEEICPEGRYEDFITSLRAFLREKKIEGGFDWDAVVISGPELFSTRPGTNEADETDEETAAWANQEQSQTGAPDEAADAYQNEFDSSSSEDEFFVSPRIGGAQHSWPRFGTWGGAAKTTEPLEDAEPGSVDIEDLIVELPPPDEVTRAPQAHEASATEPFEYVGAMDETSVEAEPPEDEIEALEAKSSASTPHDVAEDPGWGSAPAQAESLLQYIVPAEGSLSLPE